MEVHHVIPLSEGGQNGEDNLVSLCRDCHIRAHRELRPVNEWDAFVAELES